MVHALHGQIRKTLTSLREKLDSLPADLQPLAHEILETGSRMASDSSPWSRGLAACSRSGATATITWPGALA